jgi:superfamily I DNA/RNA helicase/RecB family exonuclease
MVRDLLAGHVEAGTGGWPAELRPALGSGAFAAELRDLMLRAAERGVDPSRMAALSRRAGRPEWLAAAAFVREYQQVADLRQGSSGLGAALDQAELVGAALRLLDSDRVLAAEQARIRHLFVDEYQDVDPAQAELIERLASAGAELVVVGDPDQSIYAFRGAEAGALTRFAADATVALTTSRRSGPTILAAAGRVAALLPAVPGAPAHRRLQVADPAIADAVDLRVLPTAAREAAYIADQLRRAHLLDGVPWSRMAVLMRSPRQGLAALRRACAVAGVPVRAAADDRVAVADPVAAALMSVLECGLDPAKVTGQRAMDLLASPLGGLDALALRRLRRAVRAARPEAGSAADQIAAGLLGGPLPTDLPVDLVRPVRFVAGLLQVVADARQAPTAEVVLWDVWTATGLAGALAAVSERGGTAGQRADAALDAVVGLFDAAADLAARLPRAGVAAFVVQVTGQSVPAGPVTEPGSTGAVTVLSAHASKGLEWDVVAVTGLQEGTWPDLRDRGSLLGGAQLLDLAAGGSGRRAAANDMLADERRLFYVACTRARRRLIVTAVESDDAARSRFLDELAGDVLTVQHWPQSQGRDRRALHLSELVADLRRAVCDPIIERQVADLAAAQLARLAAAGVPGAHPDQWYGLQPLSSSAPAVPPGAVVRVSPSAVEALETCALRAVLERRGARRPAGDAQSMGILVHAAAEGLGRGLSRAEVDTALEAHLAAQDQLPEWQRNRLRRFVTAMTQAVADWIADSAQTRRQLGVELPIDVALPPADGEANPVRLVGRVDWLAQRTDDGTAVVSDFKTSTSQPTKAEVADNAQLGTYQLATGLGAFDRVRPGLRSGGAELVHVRSGRPKVLPQLALDADGRLEREAAVRRAAERLAAAGSLAAENRLCERCGVRTSCPLQPEGRQVTR